MTGLSTAETARAMSVERRVHPVPTASLRRSEITICPSVRRVATIKGQGRLSLSRYCPAEEVMGVWNFIARPIPREDIPPALAWSTCQCPRARYLSVQLYRTETQ